MNSAHKQLCVWEKVRVKSESALAEDVDGPAHIERATTHGTFLLVQQALI